MNVHELYKKEVRDANKVQTNHGGRGEFYGGDQIYTTGFKDKVVPFSGKAYKLNDSDIKTDPEIKASQQKKPKNCFQRFKDRLRSIFK